MTQPLPDRPRKGRGAVSNQAGRFERHATEATDAHVATVRGKGYMLGNRVSLTKTTARRRGGAP